MDLFVQIIGTMFHWLKHFFVFVILDVFIRFLVTINQDVSELMNFIKWIGIKLLNDFTFKWLPEVSVIRTINVFFIILSWTVISMFIGKKHVFHHSSTDIK